MAEQAAPAWNSAEAWVPAARSWRILEESFGSDSLADATALLYRERARKNGYELDRLRRANEIATFGLSAFSGAVVPGATGVEIAAEVERAVALRGGGYRGVRRVRAYAQVACGVGETSRGYRPMEITSTRKLQDGADARTAPR